MNEPKTGVTLIADQTGEPATFHTGASPTTASTIEGTAATFGTIESNNDQLKKEAATVIGAPLPPGTTPGRVTHYVNLENNGPIHRAAMINEVPGPGSELTPDTVRLTVFLPYGFHYVAAKYDEAGEVHTWHFPERA